MKSLFVTVVLAGLLAVAWFALREPDTGVEADTAAETEVAVRVAEVSRTTLRAYVTAYGVVEPAPAGDAPAASASIAPSAAGIVVSVSVVEGQRVAANEVLFHLDSRAADVTANFAAMAVERELELLAIEGTSEKALQAVEQQLEDARVQQSLLEVHSPLAGTVTQLSVRPGDAVDPATVVAKVVDLDRLVVSAGVPSAEVGSLMLGQPTEIISDDSGTSLTGKLDYISAELDPRTDTALVRTTLPAGADLRPGQRVTLRVVSAEHAGRLAVPVDSIVTNEDGVDVIAIVEGDQATQIPVTTALRDGELIEIDGADLRPGMTVVTDGAYGLPAQTRVRILDN